MLSVNDLSTKIASYRDGSISLDGLSEWFRDNSRSVYKDPYLWGLCTSVEAILSGYVPSVSTQAELCDELISAIRPYENGPISGAEDSASGEPLTVVGAGVTT